MAQSDQSLPPGRRARALDEHEQRVVYNTFLGLDNKINVKYDGSKKTCFKAKKEGEEEIGEIIFGPDIYPGTEIVNPNATLSMEAAAAHELSHYHRWKDKQEICDNDYEDLDEALTSLHAVMRFPELGGPDKMGLIADAMQRISKFLHARDVE